MPGQHSPGYDAAQKRATRRAAQLWRAGEPGGPERWRELLAEELNRRDMKPSMLIDD